MKRMLRENLSDQVLNRLRSVRNCLFGRRIVEGTRNWLLKTEVIRGYPQVYLRLLIREIGYPDPELRLLSSLCEKTKCSVDIGAYMGDYAFHMLRYSEHCHVFEPRQKAIQKIRERLEGTSLPLTLHKVALSDSGGEMSLRIPQCAGRSTLETSNPLENLDEYRTTVPVRCLDDYELGEVGCIKIDVEGHEEAVIRGGIDTIRRDRPSLIIEAEERHNSGVVGKLDSLLGKNGYEGYFIEKGKLKTIESFDVQKHQTSIVDGRYVGGGKKYVNNFIFEHRKNE